MSSISSKTPPALFQSKRYKDWVEISCMCQELTKKRKGRALLLSLEGGAQEVVLEIPENDIASENDADVIINRLNRFYKKDSTDKMPSIRGFWNIYATM